MKAPTAFVPGIEPAETLGDTTPGPLDEAELLHHPALQQADEDLRLPGWGYAVLAAALVAGAAGSALWPWGFAPAPL